MVNPMGGYGGIPELLKNRVKKKHGFAVVTPPSLRMLGADSPPDLAVGRVQPGGTLTPTLGRGAGFMGCLHAGGAGGFEHSGTGASSNSPVSGSSPCPPEGGNKFDRP